jgi:hypothetical protein
MKVASRIIALLLLVTVLATSCKTPRDHKGIRKKKISMGWM